MENANKMHGYIDIHIFIFLPMIFAKCIIRISDLLYIHLLYVHIYLYIL